ncbi:MAG: segregation/condensation protein A [archaeon]
MEQQLLLDNDPNNPHNRIFSVLFNEQELTWQNIIYDLVRAEGMDPWDISVSLLAKKFLERIQQLREFDFRITGKMILAAALLVKMKSTRFLEEDMLYFDQLMHEGEPYELDEDGHIFIDKDLDIQLYPKTPQPRKRKVSVFDLVKALESALKVDARRKPVIPKRQIKITLPSAHIDIEGLMGSMYDRIEQHYAQKQETLTFTMLVPGESRTDKVLTFIPLLHLDTQRKINLEQQQHFGEISVMLLKKAS